MKIYIFLITGVFIVFILYFIYSQGEEKGETKEKLNCKDKEVIIHHEVIKENKQVQQRKKVFKLAPVNDNINFLFKNNCKDCQSR